MKHQVKRGSTRRWSEASIKPIGQMRIVLWGLARTVDSGHHGIFCDHFGDEYCASTGANACAFSPATGPVRIGFPIGLVLACSMSISPLSMNLKQSRARNAAKRAQISTVPSPCWLKCEFESKTSVRTSFCHTVQYIPFLVCPKPACKDL